ncbi:hypothetical protein VitviT2T_020290 [Vitis vinifera]|uniref:Aminotransferase class V domain-containing protein n=1 Tax=Vitis vinifera TaxID=29760 RepID=A0ABY9D364_VITVI|nr:hypothetical protein VitviT2T_020290 [Vitis vinifera]
MVCVQRGWMNVDMGVIVCESYGSRLSYISLSSEMLAEVDSAGEAFGKQQDTEHAVDSSWKGEYLPRNISIKGIVRFYNEKQRHVITTQMEHKCVRDSRPHLQQEGFEITYMFAWSGGYVNIDLMQSANQSDTGLMSVMTVEEIRNICGELGVLSYTDVAQAFGKETLSRELIQVAPYEDKTVHLDGGISPSCSPHAHHGHVTCRHPAHIVGSPPT